MRAVWPRLGEHLSKSQFQVLLFLLFLLDLGAWFSTNESGGKTTAETNAVKARSHFWGLISGSRFREGDWHPERQVAQGEAMASLFPGCSVRSRPKNVVADRESALETGIWEMKML